MKKMKITYWFLIIAMAVTTGCEDLLEEEPLTQISTESFYQNEEDALAALTGAYAQLKEGVGYYRQAWLSNLHASADLGNSSWQHGDFLSGNINDTDPNLPRSWNQIYVAIRDANNVITKVPAIADINPTIQSRILGEARFLRGLHYFNLVRAFGEVPLRTEPVVPEKNEGLPVSNIVDIYNVILADLEFAAENCWGKEEARGGYFNELGRATDAAAHALLTKAYLHIAAAKRTAMDGETGNANYRSFPEETSFYYQEALAHAEQVLLAPGFQLSTTPEEWNTIFNPTNGNNPEMLFEIQGSSITEQGTALSNLFSPRQAGLSGGGWGGTNRLVPRFINNSVDKNDPRFAGTIIESYQDPTRTFVLNPTKTGYTRTITASGEANGTFFNVFTSKYIDRSATTEYTSQQNWHVIRLADVHLMRAEALVELSGNPAFANDDFNVLRTRVGMEDFDGTGMTMDQFRTALLRERAAELYMEGHRFFDLTRMGVYNEYCLVTYDAPQGFRGPEDYTWPIPITEKSANSSID